MKLLAPNNVAAPGDFYLVDLGRLVPVCGKSPSDALSMATTSVFGNEVEAPAAEHPRVYQLDQNGEVMAVYE